jgi:hypothetical protein
VRISDQLAILLVQGESVLSPRHASEDTEITGAGEHALHEHPELEPPHHVRHRSAVEQQQAAEGLRR